MSFHTELKSILSESVIVQPNSDGTICLEEADASMEVDILSPPPCILIVDIEKLGHLARLKINETQRICDYLLISEINGCICVIFVELKKTLTNEERGKDQLRRSLPIFKYLTSVLEVHYERILSSTSISLNYILIAEKLHPRLDKQPVKASPEHWPQEEEYKGIIVKKILGPVIPFAKISCL